LAGTKFFIEPLGLKYCRYSVIIQHDITKGNDNYKFASRQACEKGLRFTNSSDISWVAVGERE
jgi:hypothetical protein